MKGLQETVKRRGSRINLVILDNYVNDIKMSKKIRLLLDLDKQKKCLRRHREIRIQHKSSRKAQTQTSSHFQIAIYTLLPTLQNSNSGLRLFRQVLQFFYSGYPMDRVFLVLGIEFCGLHGVKNKILV